LQRYENGRWINGLGERLRVLLADGNQDSDPSGSRLRIPTDCAEAGLGRDSERIGRGTDLEQLQERSRKVPRTDRG
jgi:hypothetical protein